MGYMSTSFDLIKKKSVADLAWTDAFYLSRAFRQIELRERADVCNVWESQAKAIALEESSVKIA